MKNQVFRNFAHCQAELTMLLEVALLYIAWAKNLILQKTFYRFLEILLIFLFYRFSQEKMAYETKQSKQFLFIFCRKMA